MKRIGLTGGIGSGKTTVARIFKMLDVPVYNSDEAGRRITEEDPEVKTKILNRFGPDVFDENGRLDRGKLAKVVFQDPQALNDLNEIIHPAVAADFQIWCEQQTSPYVLKEAAIVFEQGLDKQLDGVIVVEAPDALRMKRVMKRNDMSEEEVLQRMKQQWSQEDLVHRADWVIHNDEQQLLIPQVLDVYSRIIP